MFFKQKYKIFEISKPTARNSKFLLYIFKRVEINYKIYNLKIK